MTDGASAIIRVIKDTNGSDSLSCQQEHSSLIDPSKKVLDKSKTLA